jgi:hypothetical protein
MHFETMFSLLRWCGSAPWRARAFQLLARPIGKRAALSLPVRWRFPLLSRFAPVRDLLIFAKHLFVEANCTLSDAFGQHQDRMPPARLRADARGRDGGVREKLAYGRKSGALKAPVTAHKVDLK